MTKRLGIVATIDTTKLLCTYVVERWHKGDDGEVDRHEISGCLLDKDHPGEHRLGPWCSFVG